MFSDVSKHFTGSTPYERSVALGIVEREETPEAIKYFVEKQSGLRDYAYWFFLSLCWVSYTGYSDLDAWKQLFSSERSKRKHSIMMPSEVRAYETLPYFVTAYRAHRPGETDWIAYTLNEETVKRFARERGVDQYRVYRVKKRDILALFLRRGEDEVLVLDKDKVTFMEVRDIK